MKPETLHLIQEQLKVLEKSKENKDDEQKKRRDGYMFCISSCYTEDETVEYMTKKLPSSVPRLERHYFQIMINLLGRKSKQAYLEDAEDCALGRRTARCDTFEEAIICSGESSTSHKCEANCSCRHPPTELDSSS